MLQIETGFGGWIFIVNDPWQKIFRCIKYSLGHGFLSRLFFFLGWGVSWWNRVWTYVLMDRWTQWETRRFCAMTLSAFQLRQHENSLGVNAFDGRACYVVQILKRRPTLHALKQDGQSAEADTWRSNTMEDLELNQTGNESSITLWQELIVTTHGNSYSWLWQFCFLLFFYLCDGEPPFIARNTVRNSPTGENSQYRA